MTGGREEGRFQADPGLPDLLAKLAAWPHGLGLLHLSDVETVAALLKVDAYLITAAREALETPAGRAFLIHAVHEARVRSAERPAPEAEPPPGECAGSCVKTEEELIEAARSHHLGLAFLREGHPEAVAVVFRTRPEVVFRARRRLEAEKS